MSALLPGDSSHRGLSDSGAYKVAHDKQEDGAGCWYFSRREIEENSPSRKDGIDLKKETYLRKSYCTFLQDLGMRLKVPQVTIATAIIFCHRFFLRQSHAKNDRRIIATVCMFLAGKVEETPHPLKNVILVSYEIVHKKDPTAIQKIKQKEVYEQQKELVLVAERVVLATLGFDLNVNHPYKPLVEAIKKFKVAQHALAQVAWNFVNDGLRTSLCLQFKPHHIAAGAIFLATKFLKVKLPSDGDKVWWQEFDVTPRQLEEVSNQMLESYEQNRMPPPQASEAEGSAGGVQRPQTKGPALNDEHATSNSNSQGGVSTSKGVPLKPASNRQNHNQSYGDNHVTPRSTQSRDNEYGNTEMRDKSDCNGELDINDSQQNAGEINKKSRFNDDAQGGEDKKSAGKFGKRDIGEYKDGTLGQSPQDAMKKLDKDKLKAAIEKRRKSRGETTKKKNLMDEDDLIERELEDGIELVSGNDKSKQDRRQSLSKSSNRAELENAHFDAAGDDGHFHGGMKGHFSRGEDSDNVEEGEVEPFDNVESSVPSPKSSNRKRRAGSPLDEPPESKQRHDYVIGSHAYNHADFPEDRNRFGRHGFSDREHKRHMQENHV